MNGAHALLATLRANGVTTCFANPGTTEMHVVAALDDFSDLRGILCLFEGVATGAADGFARVSATPAATLLHLGPGLANGWANLHNARRARSPLVNIVGDHATYHGALDAPLQSDIASVASALEGWVQRPTRVDDLAHATARAVQAAYGPPGRVATLIVPSDVASAGSRARRRAGRCWRATPSPRPTRRSCVARLSCCAPSASPCSSVVRRSTPASSTSRRASPPRRRAKSSWRPSPRSPTAARASTDPST
jgi:acetolactate synthase-1/2/3 large subunit